MNSPETRDGRKVSKAHLGLGVIAVMSAKGTATLAATMLLPTWPLRIGALLVVIGIAVWALLSHRRKKKQPHEHGG